MNLLFNYKYYELKHRQSISDENVVVKMRYAVLSLSIKNNVKCINNFNIDYIFKWHLNTVGKKRYILPAFFYVATKKI